MHVILSFVLAANFLLGHQMMYKVNKLNAHVWVFNSAIHYNRDAGGQLCVQVDILHKVSLRIDLLE